MGCCLCEKEHKTIVVVVVVVVVPLMANVFWILKLYAASI